MAASRKVWGAAPLFTLHVGAPPDAGSRAATAALRAEVIRCPAGQDHDTNRITRFSTAWGGRAGGVFARQGIGASGAVDHSSGTRRAGFSSRGASRGCAAQSRRRWARPLLLDAPRTGSSGSDRGLFEAHPPAESEGVANI